MDNEKKINTKSVKELLIKSYDDNKREYLKDSKELLEYAKKTITQHLAIFQSATAEAWTEAKKSKKDIKDFYMEAVAPDYAKLTNITPEQAEEILKHEVGRLFKNLNGSPYCGGKYAFKYYLDALSKTASENDYSCNLFSPTSTPTPVIFPVSTLSFIAGRPSAGKTTALVSIAMNALRKGKKVLFITTEETPKQIITRFIKNQFCDNCLKSDDKESIKKGYKEKQINKAFNKVILHHYTKNPELFEEGNTLTSFEKQVIKASKEIETYLTKEQLQVYDLSATSSFSDLEEVLKEQEPYTVILLDYIQNLPYGATNDISGSEAAFREDIRKSTQIINNIIKNNDLIGIAGAQMNREGADEDNPAPFQLKNMGDSGSLERVAHIVIMLGRRNNEALQTKEFYYCIMKDREAETTGLHFRLVSNYYGYSYTIPDKMFNEDQLINITFNKKERAFNTKENNIKTDVNPKTYVDNKNIPAF